MPSKPACFQAALLESFAAAAGAWIVPAQLFDEFLVAVNDLHASLDVRFGWEAPPTLAHRLDENGSSFWSCRMMHRSFGERMFPV
jgi:hypothetical protein